MAVERRELLEIALDEFKRYNTQLVLLLTTGFVLGFIIGVGCAWSFMRFWTE